MIASAAGYFVLNFIPARGVPEGKGAPPGIEASPLPAPGATPRGPRGNRGGAPGAGREGIHRTPSM